MFADDTKIWRGVRRQEDSIGLQEDLNRLMEWSRKWLLRFNPEKCKVMHVGLCHGVDSEYTMTDSGRTWKLLSISEEKDLGVYITADLKPSLQCSKAAAKATAVLGLVRRHFKNLDKEDFLLLYNAYVRPQMEYCVQAWSPGLVRDIQCLERVQRRATKLVRGMRNKSYEDRLKALGMNSHEKRRLRGDLIETYKILTGKEKIDMEGFFQFADRDHGLRGHGLKLFVQRARTETRRRFFSHRVVSEWNRLPQRVVEATSTNCFKNRLDSYWKDMGN